MGRHRERQLMTSHDEMLSRDVALEPKDPSIKKLFGNQSPAVYLRMLQESLVDRRRNASQRDQHGNDVFSLNTLAPRHHVL